MAEVKTELRTYRVDYFCHDCMYVPIKSTSGNSNSIGTKWYHECPKCKREYVFGYNVKYPRIEYEEMYEPPTKKIE